MTRNTLITLRSMLRKDLMLLLSWRNSKAVRNFMYSDHKITIDEHRRWFNKIQDKKKYRYFIFECNKKPAGVLYIVDIDSNNHSAFWGLYKNPSGAPVGTGLAMGYLGLNYVFDRMNLYKLSAEMFSFNTKSYKLHTRLGFKKEGLFLRHTFKRGAMQDVIRVAIFKKQWQKRRLSIKRKLLEKKFKF